MRFRMKLQAHRQHPTHARKPGYRGSFQEADIEWGRKSKYRWMVAILIMAIAIGVLTSAWPKGSPKGAELLATAKAASAMEVEIPWQQTLNLIDAESTGVTKTFSYRLVPADSRTPAPTEAEDGVYTFEATGTQSGEMKLHFNFSSAGYYQYKVDAYVPERKAGYTYETDTFTVTVMVMNADGGGLKFGPTTIQDEKLAKYDSLPLVVTYRGKAVPNTDKPDTKKETDTPDITKETDTPDTTKETDTPDTVKNTDTPDTAGNMARPVSPTPRTSTPQTVIRYVPRATTPGTTTSNDDADDEPETADEPEETPEETDIDENRTPQAAPEVGNDLPGDTEENYWALLNLLCMIATAAVCGCMLGFYFYKKRKEKKEAEEKQKAAQNAQSAAMQAAAAKAESKDSADSKTAEKAGRKIGKRLLFHLLAIIPVAAAIIVFILTEDITLPMKWIDQWTLPMIIILVIEVVLEILAVLRVKGKNDKGKREPARAGAGTATPAR